MPACGVSVHRLERAWHRRRHFPVSRSSIYGMRPRGDGPEARRRGHRHGELVMRLGLPVRPSGAERRRRPAPITPAADAGRGRRGPAAETPGKPHGRYSVLVVETTVSCSSADAWFQFRTSGTRWTAELHAGDGASSVQVVARPLTSSAGVSFRSIRAPYENIAAGRTGHCRLFRSADAGSPATCRPPDGGGTARRSKLPRSSATRPAKTSFAWADRRGGSS